MRKPILFGLIAVVVGLAVVAGVLYVRYQRISTEFTNLRLAEETARVGYSEAFNAITELQDSLNAIATGDTAVQMVSTGAQSEMKVTEAVRRQALDRINALNADLKRDKERIRKLETRLKMSGTKVAGLEKELVTLRQSVVEGEALVTRLSSQVDSLQTSVAGLTTVVQQSQETIRVREQVIDEKQRELATIYYVVGSKKELSTLGFIVAKGGVLGMGKTVKVTGRYTDSFFTSLDTDKVSLIPTSAAKVQVVSAQPAASYELKLVGGLVEIHILDAKEFRKVKHFIVMTK
jgi:predicted RNase H-like nuclease (RuvC/YqgF family)